MAAKSWQEKQIHVDKDATLTASGWQMHFFGRFQYFRLIAEYSAFTDLLGITWYYFILLFLTVVLHIIAFQSVSLSPKLFQLAFIGQ